MELHGRPLKVDGVRVWRSWLGGRVLDRIHGFPYPEDGLFPEEWMISTTRANNVGREGVEEGICRLSDVAERPSLKQVIEACPEEMLGAAHVAKHGTAQGFLVKQLDSQSRLQIQAHPDQAAARRLFNSPFGKTECWHIVALRDDGPETPALFLGFREGATRERFEAAFRRQDSKAMKNLLNRIVPKPGETYIVPGGTPHAIGAGCYVVEIQEPTDITIRVERRMPDGSELPEQACHNGIGFERMFEVFAYDGVPPAEAATRWLVPVKPLERTDAYEVECLVGYDTSEFFRMDRLTVRGDMRVSASGVFYGFLVMEGRGWLEYDGRRVAIGPNDQYFVPYSCCDYSVVNAGEGEMKIIRFMGPKV